MPRVEGTDPDAYAASRERSRLRRQAQRAERGRRRRKRLAIAAGGAAAAILAVVVLVVAIGGGDGGGSGANASAGARAKPPPPPPQLPGGGRTIFPGRRVVAFYGTSGTAVLGTLGRGRPGQAAARLAKQAKAYRRKDAKVLPAFEFIATVAASAPGDDGLYATRRPLSDVRRYLRAVRKIHGLLVIDVQPGRSDFFAEVRRFAPLLREPDVSLALDPEWKMGPTEVPGQVIGHTDAATINRVSAWLAALVKRERLPQKILLVHQFTRDMVVQRPRVRQRPGLAVTVNVDGFGDRPNKLAKYRDLVPRARLFAGFKLFYTQDQDIFRPREVLRLHPAPLFVDYQ
jgi:hypothetical protein